MHTVIYLDVLLLTNGWIAVILLAGCSLLCGQYCRWPRLILAGAAAALASLSILLPQLPFWAQLAYQGITALGIVRLAFSWQGSRVFLRQVLWYVLMNLVLAGCVSAACMQGLGWMETNNLACYFQISPLVLGGASLGIYVVLAILRAQFGGIKEFSRLPLQGNGWQLTLSAYCDTGLTVVDPLTGQNVVLVYYPAVKKRLPSDLQASLETMFGGGVPAISGYRLRLLPCDTVGGQTLLPAISAKVWGKAKERSVLTAFTPQVPADKRCEALIGPEIQCFLRAGTRAKEKNEEVRDERTNNHEEADSVVSAAVLRRGDQLHFQHPDPTASTDSTGGKTVLPDAAGGGRECTELSGGA